MQKKDRAERKKQTGAAGEAYPSAGRSGDGMYDVPKSEYESLHGYFLCNDLQRI